MSKHVKMCLYGEPGTGKSVFASKAPNPFFICTDGNYEWLEDFGAKPDAHINVSSWSEAKKLIDKAEVFDNYETIVVDLTEDLFKWTESEYCVRNKFEHVSDAGYAKGYDTTRNEFFITISKLLALDKNVILIMHGISTVEKDRRGVEHTKYRPTSRIPDKVLDMIEGRVRYFLRCYVKDEEHDDGTVTKRRYLSIVPKPNEFGITRGIDENTIPQDIPLEWDEFAKIVGVTSEKKTEVKTKEVNTDVVEQKTRRGRKSKEVVEESKEVKLESKEVKSESKEDLTPTREEKTSEKTDADVIVDTINGKEVETKKTVEVPELKPVVSNEDKLAAIKAKLAAMKG